MNTLIKDKSFMIDDFVMVNNKRWALNLNNYRNSHYHALSDAKITFCSNLLILYPELRQIKANKLTVNYTIIPHNNQLFDTQNIVSIVDKFFLDALVNIGCIPDDNYTVVSHGEIRVADIEKTNKCKKILISVTFL